MRNCVNNVYTSLVSPSGKAKLWRGTVTMVTGRPRSVQGRNRCASWRKPSGPPTSTRLQNDTLALLKGFFCFPATKRAFGRSSCHRRTRRWQRAAAGLGLCWQESVLACKKAGRQSHTTRPSARTSMDTCGLFLWSRPAFSHVYIEESKDLAFFMFGATCLYPQKS